MAYFKTYEPITELKGVVDFYWRSVLTLSESLTQDVPTPLMQGMTFNLNVMAEDMIFENRKLHMNKYCYLFGQPLKPRLSLSNAKGINIFGVKFTPRGIHMLTGIDMRHLVDDIIEADSVWGTEVEWLCERMFDADGDEEMVAALEIFLVKKLRQRHKKTNNIALDAALNFMQNNQLYAIKEIQEITYTTVKTLERYFFSQVGLSPKRYARICRFNTIKSIVDQDPSSNWLDIAFDMGYYDQSHFIKEFKEFSGKTPTEYCASRLQASVGLF